MIYISLISEKAHMNIEQKIEMTFFISPVFASLVFTSTRRYLSMVELMKMAAMTINISETPFIIRKFARKL